MKVGSLFSGIGGLDLGLERAGMEITWQVENDPFCRRVLAKHWPNVPCYGDIREVSGADLDPVDLICGGFPCQPTSHAGRRRGEDDDRWLWPEMLRLIRETRPAYVVGENVFGLVTHDEGLLLASVVADLEAEGYEVAAPVVFPACAVGAPHRRDRVWVCAYAGYDRGRSTEHRQQQTQWTQRTERFHRDAYSEGLDGAEVYARSRDEGRRAIESLGHGWWACAPGVGRVVHGVPSAVDRLKALGNAVVPQAAELIGRHIMAVLA